MTFSECLIYGGIKLITHRIYRIDGSQLASVPEQGPLIIVINHVNFLDSPIIFTELQPRRVTGLMLAERWQDRRFRWLLDFAGGIPLHRGEPDLAALREAIEKLKAGQILMIAPEGTRSGHGRLQEGHPGVVLLALRSGAPILPIVYYGIEGYKENIRRLRRTDFNIVVGKPFRLKAEEGKVTRPVRQKMIDEVMYQMAALLPAEYRGLYSDLSAATEAYLDFV